MTRTRMATICLALVLLAGCNPPSTAVREVSDIDVTEHVKTALQRDADLQRFNIQVVTQKGDVRLTAVLETQAQVDAALRIARAAEGVHTLHDELTVKP